MTWLTDHRATAKVVVHLADSVADGLDGLRDVQGVAGLMMRHRWQSHLADADVAREVVVMEVGVRGKLNDARMWRQVDEKSEASGMGTR